MGIFDKIFKWREDPKITQQKAILQRNPNDYDAKTTLVNLYLDDLSKVTEEYKHRNKQIMDAEKNMIELLSAGALQLKTAKLVERFAKIYTNLYEDKEESKKEIVMKIGSELGPEIYRLNDRMLSGKLRHGELDVCKVMIPWYLDFCGTYNLDPGFTKVETGRGLNFNLSL